MALKPDRRVLDDDISYFMDVVAERGTFCILDTAGTGAAMDQAANLAKLTVGSGDENAVVLGMLMCDMVDKDLTKTHLNHHKDEVQKGGKVTIMKKGWCLTNQIKADELAGIAGGEPAYAGINGLLSTTQITDYPQVGIFRSADDGDGYVKVEVNLP
jgi:hypothetical protein